MNETREENGAAVAGVVGKNEVPQTETKSQKPRTRYSDAELEEFRVLVDEKIVKAKEDLGFLKGSLNSSNANDTKDTSPTFKWATEEGCSGLTKEQTSELISKQEKFIQCLYFASNRIKNKTYGICMETGQLISKERLLAVPHATKGMSAKLNQDQIEKNKAVNYVHQFPRPSFH